SVRYKQTLYSSASLFEIDASYVSVTLNLFVVVLIRTLLKFNLSIDKMVLGIGDVQRTSQEAQAKSLIMKAWRERWTEVQWGINIRKLVDDSADGSFLADCILQQALSGPGPNSLVLSYLMHSIHSQIVTTASVLLSVSKYDAFHKLHCVASLLDLLSSIKDRIILNDNQGKDDCIQLALALQSVVCWLLSCMYSSLENLSDITEFPAEAEDSKIVLKCRNLMDYFLVDPYLFNLINVANKEDEESYVKIIKMSKEVDKFVDGHNQREISHVTSLIDKLSKPRVPKTTKTHPLEKSFDGLQTKVGNPSIQAIIMKAALLRSSQDIPAIVSELILVKQLQNVDLVNFYSEILHSALMGLVDAFGKEQELAFIGFTFLQLPSLVNTVREKLLDSTNDAFLRGLEVYIMNESCLNVADAKLHCCTLEFLLKSFANVRLINETDKASLLKLRTSKGSSIKPTPGSSPKTFNVIITAAATTGRLQQFTSKLIKLNQLSRQASGELNKASNTRAIIFDLSFLMLCYIVQLHGPKALSSEEPDSFFEEWYKDCMVENHVAKNPDVIINRCDSNKVDLLLNQYIQGDTELKTSLVFWHEICANSVGVTKEVLTAWESDGTTFNEVKRILDVFRSKICSIPVCISAWLCAYIQVNPEEKSTKAKEILNYFLTSSTVMSFDNQDHFKERNALMSQIISRMMNCIQSSDKSPVNSPTYNFESKPVAELYKSCWACMNKRGLIDVETTVNLQHLLQMSGPHYFVQNMVEEMLRLQHSQELAQRCDLLYGVLHYDLKSCTAALVRVVVPTVLHFWTSDSSFMEPQIKALVSLSVDCILSYYYHASSLKIKEERKDESDSEPQSKRRKLFEATSLQKENLVDLQIMLKDLYGEFYKVLHNVYESTPAIVFILQFLEELSMKTPTTTLLTSLPHQVVTQLMSLMCDEMDPDLLLGLFCLTNKNSRLNCAQALCRLKHLRHINEYHEPRSHSPAPGS
ncbi:Mediator of RNA polymerase II transcription subunit 24, partial [Orchesella cincta]